MPVGTLDTKRLPAGSVLVVGAGLAGLYLALKLAPRKVYIRLYSDLSAFIRRRSKRMGAGRDCRRIIPRRFC